MIRNSPIPRAPLNTLFVSIDEDLEWVYEDDAFLKNVSQALFKLINDGMRICHIIHSNTDPYQLVQYLKLWLPLYVTGKVEVHWCYHPQPQIYRRSIILAPSSGAVFYNTANTKRDDPATLLTSDKQLMHSLTYELQSFFPFFSPVLQEVSVSDGIGNNEMPLVSKLQQTPSLSVETTPAILVQHCMEHASTQEQKELLQSHLMQSVRFEHLLQNPSFTYTDTAYIAPVQAVKKGEIKMLVSNGIHEEPVAYTPEMYTLHLQNILRLLKTYPNYNFIPAIHKIHFDFILIVQDNKEVLIIRTAPPFNSFLIKQQNIVNACSQMISNENSNYLNIHTRADIIKHLEAIIADLV